MFSVTKRKRASGPCPDLDAHYAKRLNEHVLPLVFWNPTQGSRVPERLRLTYPELLSQDAGIRQDDLLNLMKDRVQTVHVLES